MATPKEIFDSVYNEAIAKNQQSMYTWSKYKEDLSAAQNLINVLTDKVSHDVMVPLGPKAMMPGKIVHTNEYLVSLGASYFIKQSAKQTKEFCDRKIKSSDEMLNNLEEELKLMTSKTALPDLNDAFGREGVPDIIEHVTEEEDKKWREEHKQKVKEYHSQLADIRKEDRKKIESEEDVWELLDQLELEEELQDEINRLSLQEYNKKDNDQLDLEDELQDEINRQEDSKKDGEKTTKTSERKHSVIFAEDPTISEDEPIYLNFKHSSFTPEVAKYIKNINSPSDIYLSFLENAKNCNPASILKVKNNPNQKREVSKLYHAEEKESISKVVSPGFEIPDVFENPYSNVVNLSEPVRENLPPAGGRISRFKASRMKK